MKKFSKSGWQLLIILVAWGAYNLAYPSATWRYRTTVQVETPEGIKTGSSVREVLVKSAPKLLPEAGGVVKVIGEAVVVDLGKRGVLFALMKNKKFSSDYGYKILFDALKLQGPRSPEGIRRYQHLEKKRIILQEEQYPLLVRFLDLNNQRSVRSVGSFENAFGEGVRLKEISIEITNDAVTWKIKKWLPWLSTLKGLAGYFGSPPERPTYDPTGLYLNGLEFSRGEL